LVLAGNPAHGEYYDAILHFIKEKKLEKNVLFIGHLNDKELSYVYGHAEALVFPTLIEGFGYPVLEAMDCGVPVITSDQSSLKEIGGDAALLVNPYNPDEIAGAMRKLIEKPDLRQKLVQKGITQSERFSWHKAGRELLTLAEKLNT